MAYEMIKKHYAEKSGKFGVHIIILRKNTRNKKKPWVSLENILWNFLKILKKLTENSGKNLKVIRNFLNM